MVTHNPIQHPHYISKINIKMIVTMCKAWLGLNMQQIVIWLIIDNPYFFLCAICAWLSQKYRKSDVKPQILEAILFVNIYVSTSVYVFSSKIESCVFVSCIYKRQNVILCKVRESFILKRRLKSISKKVWPKSIL